MGCVSFHAIILARTEGGHTSIAILMVSYNHECRFRSAKDLKEARAEAEKKGVVINEDLLFDSNVITPGTEFMDKVSHWFRA